MRLPLFLFSFILMAKPLASAVQVVQIPAKFDRKICDQLLETHIPDEDVSYKPGVDVDGNPVVSADVEGSMKLNLPKEIVIPIDVDLGKYYREPTPQLVQNFAQLNANQQAIDGQSQTLEANFASAQTQQTAVRAKIDDIQENVISHGTVTGTSTGANTGAFLITATQLKAKFDALATDITKATTTLSGNVNPVTSTVTQLENSVGILDKRIKNNPVEKDLTIIQENQKYLEAGKASISKTQGNIATNTRLISEAQTLLTEATALLSDTKAQGILGTTNLSTLQSTYAGLQTALTAVSSNTTNASSATKLSGLNTSLNTLSNLQIENYNKIDLGIRKAQVGEVKVNLLSGALTFNGQPLTNPERTQLIAKCRKVYGG